ncbi:hypothetical protein ISS05_00410 [Candidatus Woesearchaeota archaeon]|nr:hypothetical protein [Candidatus Woesearchaeota archaeon]
MAEKVWRITGFNRHPSLIESLKEEVLPIFANVIPLQVATVPCSTGIEALAIAIGLEKEGYKYNMSGFDTDREAIEAAKMGQYFICPTSGQIIGDPHSNYEYHWSNLTAEDRLRYFRELGSNGKTMVESKPDIAKNLRFGVLGIQDIPPDSYDVIFCINFLKYLTDQRFSADLPTLEVVSKRLFQSNKSLGALIIDPTSDKVDSIREALITQGYSKLNEGTYLKCL